MKRPYIIGITGGSGSGKTTIVRKISEIIPDFVIVAQDNYYKSAEFITNTNITAVNFDHPDAFDTDLLHEHLTRLKNGETIQMPQYDFMLHKRKGETISVNPKNVIILEGIMVLTDKKVRDLLDLKIFVDTPGDIRFIRRLQRDVGERGRTHESVVNQYLDVVRPGHDEFIEPTKNYADIIIPEGGYKTEALHVLVSFMKDTIANGTIET